MIPSTSPVSIRELLLLLGMLLLVTETNVVTAITWAMTTRPVLWEPLALAAVGTLWFDLVEQRARRAALDDG